MVAVLSKKAPCFSKTVHQKTFVQNRDKNEYCFGISSEICKHVYSMQYYEESKIYFFFILCSPENNVWDRKLLIVLTLCEHNKYIFFYSISIYVSSVLRQVAFIGVLPERSYNFLNYHAF